LIFKSERRDSHDQKRIAAAGASARYPKNDEDGGGGSAQKNTVWLEFVLLP
jgi:hypothetical protein